MANNNSNRTPHAKLTEQPRNDRSFDQPRLTARELRRQAKKKGRQAPGGEPDAPQE